VEPLPPASGRTTRLALVAGGLLILLAVVAFASRAGFGGSAKRAAPSTGYVNYAFTAFLIVFVLAIPFVAYTFLLQAREGTIARKSYKRRLIANMLVIVFFSLIAAAVLYAKAHHWHLFHVNLRAIHNTKKLLSTRQHNAKSSYSPKFEWSLFWVAVVLVTGAASAFVVMRIRRKRRPLIPLPLEPTIAEELASSISTAIDDLEAEPDARRAVIAAYARMEGVLGRHGLHRRPSETPVEYLGRVLLQLSARGDAVERLTGLFERAKFSTHEIDASMKADAIGALREIRDDLRA
jgi:hypothetical protein